MVVIVISSKNYYTRVLCGTTGSHITKEWRHSGQVIYTHAHAHAHTTTITILCNSPLLSLVFGFVSWFCSYHNSARVWIPR